LLSTKSPFSVRLSPRSFQINYDFKAMLTTVKAVSLQRLDLDLVDAGAESVVTLAGNDFVPLPNLDLRFALAPSVQMDSHPPAPDSIAFNEWIW
jgi:hypothetical protein